MPSTSQPARVRMAGRIEDSEAPVIGSGPGAAALSPQRVDQGGLEMLEEDLGAAGRLAAEEALDEDAVERRHDEPGVQVRVHRRAEYSLLATAVDDVGEQVAVYPLQLVHVPDHVVGVLLLPQDEAHDELDRIDVLGDERVVGVDQLPYLIDLGETLQVVEHVDDVGLQGALEGGPEELLLVLEVPEDERLRDLGLLGDLREGGVGEI